MSEILRETLIHHALERDVVAIRNRHGEDDCVAIGRIVKVGPNHLVVVGRGHESSIPIAKVSDVRLLEGEAEERPRVEAAAHGVTT
jgi:hypothetical protein